MKKSVRVLALILILAMSLCLLPAAAAEPKEWVYKARTKGESYKTVQIGAYPAQVYAETARDLMRSYGYEAFVYNAGRYSLVCVGLYDAGTKADDGKVQDAINDFKTLTRAGDDYLTSCCSAFLADIKLPEGEAQKFSAFGGTAPSATETPKRTSIEVQEPEELYKDGCYRWVKIDADVKRIYAYYGPDAEESGIAGYVKTGEYVKMIGHTGNWVLVEKYDGARMWTQLGILSTKKPEGTPPSTPAPTPKPPDKPI